MALGGLGIGMCPLYVVEQYIMDGSLTLLFEDKETPEFLLNAIYPPNRHLTARIRALIDHLVNTLDS
jgi:DNA-binding transcriptional LysR family regulator